MSSSEFLKLGNVRKVQQNLRPILAEEAIEAIETEIKRHSEQLFNLALDHYRFATGLSTRHWRQRVSRLYYAAYAGSRAIRLYVYGDHSTDVKDHQKIGSVPDDFPDKARFSNFLDVLRDDRNSCDYDHVSRSTDLVTPPAEAAEIVKAFLIEVKAYLAARGLNVRGKIS